MDEGRVAVVTGGASGIGLAVSRRLAADGHLVAVLDLDAGSATAAAEGIEADGGRALGLPADVADREQVFAAVAEAGRRLGPPRILVNNAGMGAMFKRFLDVDPDVWERVLRVNLTGAFHCCQAVLPGMVEARWGRIVNISSSTRTRPGPPGPVRIVEVGAQRTHQTLALDRRRGITVNTIPPGFIDTPMLRASEERGEFGPGGVDDAIARTPVRRAGRPEDIAATCSFLCRDEAGYITGQIIGVNGGRNT